MALVLAAGFAVRVCGGILNPTAGTNSLTSAMFTLEDIYQYISAGNTGAVLKAFTEPTAGPASTMHTLTDIMGVVTQRAPVARTGWKTSYQTNDDGMYQKGVSWPTPRFSAVGTGDATNQIRDNLTGLIWARQANIATNGSWSLTQYGSAIGTCTWYQAMDVVTNPAGPVNGTLSNPNGYGGTNDWRMPNIREMQSLIDYSINDYPLPAGHPFNSFGAGRYWTSTPPAYSGATKAWYVSIANSVAGCSNDDKTKYSPYYVWPVRGGR